MLPIISGVALVTLLRTRQAGSDTRILRQQQHRHIAHGAQVARVRLYASGLKVPTLVATTPSEVERLFGRGTSPDEALCDCWNALARVRAAEKCE